LLDISRLFDGTSVAIWAFTNDFHGGVAMANQAGARTRIAFSALMLVVFFAMATLASVIKRDLSGMGKFLFVGAIIVFVGFLVNFFLQSSALMLTLLVVCLGVFSAFMLYDIKRVIDGGETNYVSATLAIYLDIYNVFQSLLALLGIFGGERD
jgi:FtsH-binding integral membrane protein